MYKDQKFYLENFTTRIIIEEGREVKKQYATYKGVEYAANSLLELRGLLGIVFDKEMKG